MFRQSLCQPRSGRDGPAFRELHPVGRAGEVALRGNPIDEILGSFYAAAGARKLLAHVLGTILRGVLFAAPDKPRV